METVQISGYREDEDILYYFSVDSIKNAEVPQKIGQKFRIFLVGTECY